jgi:hypothetical protein
MPATRVLPPPVFDAACLVESVAELVTLAKAAKPEFSYRSPRWANKLCNGTGRTDRLQG